MKYELLRPYPNVEGAKSLPVGAVIKSISLESQGDYIGHDKRNLFWTVDFVQARPQIFKPI